MVPVSVDWTHPVEKRADSGVSVLMDQHKSPSITEHFQTKGENVSFRHWQTA